MEFNSKTFGDISIRPVDGSGDYTIKLGANDKINIENDLMFIYASDRTLKYVINLKEVKTIKALGVSYL